MNIKNLKVKDEICKKIVYKNFNFTKLAIFSVFNKEL